jgi:hypothetical protein
VDSQAWPRCRRVVLHHNGSRIDFFCAQLTPTPAMAPSRPSEGSLAAVRSMPIGSAARQASVVDLARPSAGKTSGSDHRTPTNPGPTRSSRRDPAGPPGTHGRHDGFRRPIRENCSPPDECRFHRLIPRRDWAEQDPSREKSNHPLHRCLLPSCLCRPPSLECQVRWGNFAIVGTKGGEMPPPEKCPWPPIESPILGGGEILWGERSGLGGRGPIDYVLGG